MKIEVRVILNAKKSELIREQDWIKAKIDAPAKEGKANIRLVELLSEYFSVPKSKIKIIKGQTSRNKIIYIKEK